MNILSVEVLAISLLLSVGAYFSTGSIFASIVVLLAIWLLAYFLGIWFGLPLEFPVQFVFDTEHAPEPGFNFSLPFPIGASEVFYIAGDRYTYKEAADVCAVYDAQLATYEQLIEAHATGAEWCGYGWTQGGMALYPVQEETWKFLQQEDEPSKRKSCGRPGINGGYFDPNTKFGVNCYGVKPGDTSGKKYPIPIGHDKKDTAFIEKLKKDMASIKVWPFNRNGWSQWGF